MRPKWWMAPGHVRQAIRSEDNKETRRRIRAAERVDLVSFKQG
jgi:hypothetical protein